MKNKVGRGGEERGLREPTIAGKKQANTPLMLTCVSLQRLQEKAIFFTRGFTLLTLITVPWIATNLPTDMT